MTPRMIQIMRLLRRHKFLNRALIQSVVFPNDKDGSVTREILRRLLNLGYVRRMRAQAGNPESTYFGPVYVPSERGCAVLATETGDMSLLLDAISTTNWTSFTHYIRMSGLFITIDAAIEGQEFVSMPKLFHEHDIVNPDASDPSHRFKLYTTVLSEQRGAERVHTVCNPDAAALFTVGQFSRPYYVELERGTDTPKRAAAKKAPGYYWLNSKALYKRHFPAEDMRVLAVCPNAGWRDSMRRAMQQGLKGKELWLFVARPDITAESFLHEPILYRCSDDKPIPLVPPAALPHTEAKEEVRAEVNGELQTLGK